MKKKIFALLALVMVAMTASAEAGYSLKAVASDYGTIAFTVGGETAKYAQEGDEVTVTITPNEGWSTGGIKGQWYAAVANSRTRADIDLLEDFELTPVEGKDNQWTFTMQRANVEISATYLKLLTHTDITVQDIAAVTYNGQEQKPTVTVKDGTTTLTLDTDYSVSYESNLNAGTATATIAGTGNYAGQVVKQFTILKADITVTAPVAVEGLTYSGDAQTLVSAATASFGTVLYSLDGETYAEALPQGTDAGSYTVYYKVDGDDNHNDFSAQKVNVVIATDKTALNTAISEAEEYYDSIENSNPDAASDLQSAINAAKTVQGDADATQTEIDTATQALIDAMNAAKAIVDEDDQSPTGINAVSSAADKDGTWYDLNGQRTENPRKGIYLQRGRKVVFK